MFWYALVGVPGKPMSPDETTPPRTTYTVRRATADDLRGMARVHVETWKTTYRGLVPDEKLDRLNVEDDIAAGFGSWLKDPPPGVGQFVALTGANEVVGFALGCFPQPTETEYTGELGAIYALKSHQGRGVGTSLVSEVARHLLGLGRSTMIVWVLEENPYRRFYEHLGGVFVRKRVAESRLAGTVSEVSYGWKDLRRLATL